MKNKSIMHVIACALASVMISAVCIGCGSSSFTGGKNNNGAVGNVAKPYYILPEDASEGLEYESNGDGTCAVVGIGTCTDDKIIVPSYSPEGDFVTEVGREAFGEELAKEELGLFSGPEGTYVYYNGEKVLWEDLHRDIPLTEIILSDSIKAIEDGAFLRCRNLSSVRLSNALTAIGEKAFHLCDKLTEITLPDSLTSIGDNAFSSCMAMASVTMPKNLTGLGEYAFNSCDSLTEIVIPGGVKTISKSAFVGCEKLSNVVIENGVTTIGYAAFSDCENLKTVTVPASLTRIDTYAFLSCSALKKITFEGTSAQWNGISKDDYWDWAAGNYTVEFADGGSGGTEWEKCPRCNYGYVTCSRCGGEGKVFSHYQNGQAMDKMCGGCAGSGMDYCDYCNGTGKVK